jgi:MFS family permease
MATLKSDYISERDRANKITKFTYIGLTGSFIGTLAGGQLFDTLHAITGKEETYSLIFMFTAFISIIGALLFFFSVPATNKTNILKDNLSPVSFVNRDLKQKNSHLSILKKTKGYLKKFRLFWIFTIFSMIFYFAVYSVGPFFILIEIDVFKFTFFEASIITSISIIDQVVISILLVRGNLLNKYGRKPFLGLGTLIIIIFSFLFLLPYFFLSLFSPILFLYCFFIWLLLGFGWGLFNSTIAVLILDIAHPQYRSVLIAYFNTFTGLMMFIGPVIGGITIDMTNNLITPFILRVVIITISLIYLIRFVKEPAISGIELKPLKNVFPFFTRMSSARGPELGISYGNEKLARKKHL